eukprot:TRINITY_DN9378_c0_g2_i5.p1 TRINITY_DN9378_c0_g2~~TRINITY_DN9378_c0_g2_i5.p1  ORF type:complete len:165 (+),score=14.89 TRINITY_DN9378_c0_g2_i5:149-643(+)
MPPSHKSRKATDVSHAPKQESRYFKKAKRSPTREEQLKRVSSFRKRVFDMVRAVPKGKVTTYGSLAKALNCGSAQAIGQAMRHNPYALQYYKDKAPNYPDEMVPCHRVIASDLTLGGFGGQTDIHHKNLCDKVALLKAEGVPTKRSGDKIKLADKKNLLLMHEA